jgi:hypothetical protein
MNLLAIVGIERGDYGERLLWIRTQWNRALHGSIAYVSNVSLDSLT